MVNNDQNELQGTVLTDFPLPIAFEFRQLLDLPEYAWQQRCKRLANVVQAVVRLGGVIALSEFLYGSLPRTDPEIGDLAAAYMTQPSFAAELEFLKGMLPRYERPSDSMFMPEIYTFCFQPDGNHSENVWLIESLTRFASRMDDVAASKVEEFEYAFEDNYPRAMNLLQNLRFLTRYELLQLVNYRESETKGSYTWEVRVLRGAAINAGTEMRTMSQPLEPDFELALKRTGEPSKFLYLHPFALMRNNQVEAGAEAEGFFLYDRFDAGKLVYISLQDDLSEQPQIRRESKYLPDLIARIPGLVILSQPREVAVLAPTWKEMARRARSKTEGQLGVFEQEKYKRDVYLERATVQDHFENFMQGDKNGLLILGDSGTGKTNLLSYIAETELAKNNIVLLYNCADLHADLISEIQSDLGLGVDFVKALQQIAGELPVPGTKFLLLLDALNEHNNPEELLHDLFGDLLLPLPTEFSWFKIVISCRSEAFVRLRNSFKAGTNWYRTEEGIEVRLTKFTPQELEQAYALYQQSKDLGPKTAFKDLSEHARHFIADPLMLRLVAESYAHAEVPKEVDTARVFQRYLERKIRDSEVKRELVATLRDQMCEQKTDELVIKDLREDEQIGKLIDWAVTAPYFTLLEDRLLVEFGPGDIRTGHPSKLKFTYDRVFEYLLMQRIFPENPTIEQLVSLIHESRSYASLWGAVKTGLVILADRTGLEEVGAIADLCQREDYETQGMMIDFLSTYGQEKPGEVAAFLKRLLQDADFPQLGLIAIYAADRLQMLEVLLEAARHRTAATRQLAVQHAYYLWQVDQAQGDRLLHMIGDNAKDELQQGLKLGALAKTSAIAIAQMAVGKDVKIGGFEAMQSLLELTMFLFSHSYKEPQSLVEFGRVWLDVAANFPKGPIASAVSNFMINIGVNGLSNAFSAGEVISLKNMSPLFERDVSDPLRVKFVRWLSYVDPDSHSLAEIAGEVFEIAQIPDGMLFMLVGMILTPRAEKQFDDIFQMCRRMIEEGNEFSKYTGLKWLEFIIYIEDIFEREYVVYLEDSILRWANEKAMVSLYGEDYKVPLLLFPIMLECRNKETGKIRFVQRALRRPWGTWGMDVNTRISYAIRELQEATAFISGSKRISPIPILETLKQWFEDPDPQVQAALAAALANIRQVYPTDVDAYLAQAPGHLVIETRQKLGSEASGKTTQRAAHLLAAWIMTTPQVREAVIKILADRSHNAKDITDVIRPLAAYFFDIHTLESVARTFADMSAAKT
jgi:hypothetical protein